MVPYAGPLDVVSELPLGELINGSAEGMELTGIPSDALGEIMPELTASSLRF
jgi:hypothetical protein